MAEFGSSKWLANNMMSKGLQRLRWYCQTCERQCRDANAFKQHTLSESHNRKIGVVAENSRKFINDWSEQFKRDFLSLLRTAHGEKKVHANHFYQEYIADKEHVHMNATRWHSLTEFVKYLGREGICRVEEGERGLEIAWIDDSPEALRRREAVAKKARMEKGDEEREARLLEAQIKKANELKELKKQQASGRTEDTTLEGKQTAPVSFSFTFGAPPKTDAPTSTVSDVPPENNGTDKHTAQPTEALATISSEEPKAEAPKTMSFGLGAKSTQSKPVNVFSSKNNPLKQKKSTVVEQPKKMSELERIMLADKEEQERKRQRMQGRDQGREKRVRLD